MTNNRRNAKRIAVITLYTALCMAVPVLFLWVGTRSPGIDLAHALYAPTDWEPFRRLLFGTTVHAENFRYSAFLGIFYATTTALLATALAYCFAVWTAHWSRRKGVGLAFVLLTLVLLPQTYLIMPGLLLLQELPVRPPEGFMIGCFLLIGVVPVTAWALYLLGADRIRKLHYLCAADGTTLTTCLLRTLYHIRVELVVVFVLAWAMSWGNFLVPYSLGSRNSFPAVVQIATFTTNLGRDWAMIGAAGFLVAFPGILAGVLIGSWILTRLKISAVKVRGGRRER